MKENNQAHSYPSHDVNGEKAGLRFFYGLHIVLLTVTCRQMGRREESSTCRKEKFAEEGITMAGQTQIRPAIKYPLSRPNPMVLNNIRLNVKCLVKALRAK